MAEHLRRVQVGEDRAVLAAIVESSHDAIIGMSRDGVISSWNPAAARLYGYSAEEAIGQPADTFVPQERRVDEADIQRRIMAGDEVERYRTERLCADGSVVAVSLTISPIIDEAGAVIGAATTSRRFSELEEARDRFEVRMAKLRSEAVDAAERFEVQVSKVRAQAAQAQERFEIQVDRERAELKDAESRFRTRRRVEASGASQGRAVPRETISADDREMRDAHDRFEVRVAEQRAEAHAAAKRFETHVNEAHDQDQYAQERFEELVENERAQADDAADRFQARTEAERAEVDNDRRKLEAQLQQGQRLEILGQLAGGVAHDFNNLLAVILNYAAFVAEEIAATHQSESMAAAGRDVEQIQRAAQRATDLTHQLLAFARREVIQPRVLDLNHVVDDVKQLLDRTIGEDVVLHTALAEDVGPILADTGQIEQVLVNLAVNARDAMSDGGILSIETTDIVVSDGVDLIVAGSPLPPGRYVRLQVRDTGIGMSPEIIEHVFEPFYTTKRDGTGTGLGLATVYGIVAQADAVIEIRSQCGIGTTFTIMFPVTDQAAVPIEPAPAYQHVPTGQMVLIVEDEEALRDVVARIFTRSGYRVITAASGSEALALAAGHDGDIDLLVTDVVMPNMLGKEVAERIREHKPTIEVLYISGYARPVLALKGRLDPDVHLIEKPFSASAILQKAGQLLQQSR